MSTFLAVWLILTCTLQKNASGKIIIVYDEDERIASQAATTMCQRGFENLFMLSGGPSMTMLLLCKKLARRISKLKPTVFATN